MIYCVSLRTPSAPNSWNTTLSDQEIESTDPGDPLNSPPDSVPEVGPVATRIQVLPFDRLTWENFERLCCRLAGKADHVEHYARYGRSGQAQQGIDIFARRSSGKYDVWQAKRCASYSAGDVRDAVDAFLAGTWSDRAERLVLAVQCSLLDIKLQEEVEKQAARLKKMGVIFLPVGGEELSERLGEFPELVDDFFGREWAKAFLSTEAVNGLGSRLDGREFARVRLQLREFYHNHFHLLDIGIPLPIEAASQLAASPSLLERFTPPDVLVQERLPDDHSSPPEQGQAGRSDPYTEQDQTERAQRGRRPSRRDSLRRVALSEWLTEGSSLAAVGDAGTGKSTLLRCIALDLLHDRRLFPALAQRWGNRLPLHISFPRWSRTTADARRQVGLGEVLNQTLQPFLTADLLGLLNRAIDERRILLLVDGLDEWTEEQSARITLQFILTFVATHDIPTVITGRPQGLAKLGALPADWRVATLAPLSPFQQEALATVWFSRLMGFGQLTSTSGGTGASINLRIGWFFRELQRDAGLLSLAEIPLLLIGLVALAVRQIALPRNKIQVVQQLVDILLEIHPQSRATAAGDTHARFVHIPDTESRRATLGRLAFGIRSEGADAGFPVDQARKLIREYLTDGESYGYTRDRAIAAASEILAVNSETVGLLVERAPGEIGFSHAMFEDFLSAVHVQSWRFPDIVTLVREKAGDARWKNVISNVVSLSARRTEADDLIAALEAVPRESLNIDGDANRDVLLAEIAFNPSKKSPATASRLVDHAFRVIERGTWLPGRREVLRSALMDVSSIASGSRVDERLDSWAPRRERYSNDVFLQLGTWAPAPDLLEALLRGICDEERATQRSAARAIAAVYKGNENVRALLQESLRTTLDVSVAAALIEGLTLGWPSWSELPAHHDAALRSKDPTLRLVGIMGRVQTGRANNEDRDAVIDLLSEFPRIDYWDQPHARELLIRRWPDDEVLITMSLECLEERGPVRDGLERESATYYLLRCSPCHSRVAEWVKGELTKDYPFVLAHQGAWPLLAPFAAHSPEIRAKTIDHIISEKGRAFLHYYQDLIVALNDQRLRDWLLEIARRETDFSLYWAVRVLIQGWGRADPLVRALLDDIAEWEDQRLLQLLSILPEIMTDPAACRARLIAIGQSNLNLRSDLLAAGFVALSCTAEDHEVVALLLASLKSGAPAFDGTDTVLANFPTHPDVRRFALECLESRDPPLPVLARSYETDPLMRPRILAYANCLPTALREVVIEDAANEVQRRPASQNLLRDYDVEVDADLKIKSSIHYHSQLKTTLQEDIGDHIDGLLQTVQAVGPNLHERRAAAFAGILVLGGVARIAAMREFGDKPMRIQTGSGYGRESDSLMGLIAERWETIQEVFGTELPDRFGDLGGDAGHMWDCLAPHIARSEFARRDFISYCEQGDSTLGLQGFRALARERPGSDLLLEHCWKVLQGLVSGQHARHSPLGIRRARLEIARILRNQFGGREDVRDRLRERVTRERGPDGLIALAMFSPADEMLKDLRSTPLDIGVRYQDWTCAIHLAGARSDAAEFGEVVCAMVNRDFHNFWDFQEVTNAAVIERLQKDSLAAQHLKVGLARQATENERASIPRYLAAAGLMDRDLYDLCRSLLQEERENHGFARAGFDAVDNSIRSISQSLLDVLSSSSVL